MGHLENRPYNGWTNYATWRIQTEFVYGNGWHSDDGKLTPEMLEDEIREIIYLDINNHNSFAANAVDMFLAKVNWQELVDELNAVEDY